MTAPDARPDGTAPTAAALVDSLRSGGVALREAPAALRAVLGEEGATPLPVAMPADDEQARFVLAAASRTGVPVAPLGSGRGLQAAGRARGPGLLLSTEAMSGVIEHSAADFVVRVRTGTRLRTLQQSLAASRQWLALEPPDAEVATIGGLMGAAASSLLEASHGTLRATLLGCRVLHGDGRITHAGGKVVKNVSGYDLMKLYHGAHGSLGVVLDVTLRLRPLPASDRLLVAEGEDLLGTPGPTALRDSLPADPTALHLTGRLERPGEQLGLRFHGDPAAVEVLVAAARRSLSSHCTAAQVHEVPSSPDGVRPPFLQELQRRLSCGEDPGLLLSLHARPSRAAAVGRTLREWAKETAARGAFVLDGGTGRWWLRFEGEAPPSGEAVERLRRRLVEPAVRIEVLSRPAGWPGGAAGEPSAPAPGESQDAVHAALTRRLCERLDPTGVLGHGGEEAR